jgi:CRISPR-associated endoribonuclease Cas2 subtype I-E
MPWLVVILENPEPTLRGWLRSRLPEMPGMVFAGRVPGSLARHVVQRVEQTRGRATLLAASAACEYGFRVRLIGHTDYKIIDSDGFLLVGKTVRRQRKVK